MAWSGSNWPERWREGAGVVGSTIEIGGELAESAIFDLLAAAEEDAAVLEGRQAEYDDEDLRLAVASARALRFTRARSPREEFVELEAFCREQGLTFRRFGDGGASGEPGVLFWAPGVSSARAAADVRGRVYLTLAELEVAVSGGETLEDVVAALRARSGAVPALVLRPD